MFLSNGHIPEDVYPDVILHGKVAIVQDSKKSSSTWYIVMSKDGSIPWQCSMTGIRELGDTMNTI